MTEDRDTFIARLNTLPGSVLFSEDEKIRCELIYDLAKYAHRAQERKDGTRYFEHPRRVALIILDEFKLYRPRMVKGALCHDGWEDSPKYLTPVKIRIICGPDVEDMIRLLSKNPKEGYMDRLMRFADWETLLVKFADRIDNMRDMPTDDSAKSAAFRRKYARETHEEYGPLLERLEQIIPYEHRHLIRYIADELHKSLTAIGYKDPPTD